MPDQLQLRGGTTAQNDAFTGAAREVTVDTTKNTLIVHNNVDAGGAPLLREDGANSELILGSAATPSLKFTGDTNTGIFSPGADQVAVSTGGTERVEFGASEVVFNDGGADYDFRIEGDTEANLLFVDASTDRIGVGTATPQGDLSFGASAAVINLDTSDGSDNKRLVLNGGGGSFNSGRGGFIALSGNEATNPGNVQITMGNASGTGIVFNKGDGTSCLNIDSSGRLLVGTSTARTSSSTRLLQIEDTNSEAGISLTRNAASVASATFAFVKTRGTAVGDNTAVQEDDQLGTISFYGANGTNTESRGAQIVALVDGEPWTSGDTTDLPGRLSFQTTPEGSGTPTERMRITSSGRVGIGTTAPSQILDLKGSAASLALTTSGASDTSQIYWRDSADAIQGYLRYDHSGESLAFAVNGASEKMRIDSAGRLLVGRTTEISVGAGSAATTEIQNSSGFNLSLISVANSTGAGGIAIGKSRGGSVVQDGDDLGSIVFAGHDGTDFISRGAAILAQVDGVPGSNDMPGRLIFSTTADGSSSTTEAVRITSDGDFGVGQGANTPNAGAIGFYARQNGQFGGKRNSGHVVTINRGTDDGNLVQFYQGDIQEGSIEVSGSTVSYNGGHLARWSQLPGGVERTEILRGSVLSNIDEMCEWGDEENEQLNRMKVSDVEGDKNVSGVFQNWDDDDDTYTNDFSCAMTGDFIIRIAQGVTVERGDLLMSAGDGTAKPQDDDIIRSKTIAKVTSTNVSCTYDDGSYCVPCVLMAC